MLSDKEFEEVKSAHENEPWWYLFLNYGCPISSNKKYEEKFSAIAKALEEYIVFVNEAENGSKREIYL